MTHMGRQGCRPAGDGNVKQSPPSESLPSTPWPCWRQVEVVERAWLPHQVEPGNFYHSVGEVLPSLFANWCTFVGACRFQDRGAAGFEVGWRAGGRMGG